MNQVQLIQPKARRLRSAQRRLAIQAAASLSAVFGARLKDAFGILTYHRLAEETTGLPAPSWNVTPQRFREQLTGLLARGYQAWPLRCAVQYRLMSKPIPRNVFVVTFDDGYQCVYHNAWPVLCELNVPATIFLATAYLDSSDPFPFDDWSAAGMSNAIESWQPLTTAQCREMQASGLIELGSHTHQHDNFRGRTQRLQADLVKSLDLLRCRFGLTDATFAFPFGVFDSEMCALVKGAGLLCALTTQSELVAPESDRFQWGRFTVHEHDNGRTLAAQLAGWFSLARRIWLRMRRPEAEKGTAPLCSKAIAT
jgi:peptidoglycan/xylan/chitin deacetylase (PgdA/CDA1 family)